MRGSNPRLLAHKTNTLPTELMEQRPKLRACLFFGKAVLTLLDLSFESEAVLAEWLRRMLKAHVRKSVGSIPTDCKCFFFRP